MKCANVAGGGAVSDDMLMGTCWLDPKLDPSSPPPSCHDLIDSLLAPPPLSEVKPLPPFTGYTGHLSINGISGHHFHAIAQRLPEENNNYPTQSGYGADHDVVSSSTCAADAEPPDLEDVKPFSLEDTKPFSAESGPGPADSCAASCSSPMRLFDDNHKPDMYDMSYVEDIAAIIGSAIADTTVPSQPEDPEKSDTRDSWMDFDEWISSAYNQQGEKIVPHDLAAEFGVPSPPPAPPSNHHSGVKFSIKGQEFSKCQEFLQKNLSQAGSTLQGLLTHDYMPLLQRRLQNGPPVKQEAPSSTSYGMDVISTSSPPGNAVSTTDGLGGLLNGRYPSYTLGLKSDGLCSPERLLGYAHAHTTTSTPISKSKRSRAKAKQVNNGGNIHGSLAFQSATAAELSGLLGKEKPVHRCGICNRGFLNKSNIKVHLRTHTGEKPFRCDVCAKAFRQKAHLIKHQQIHKRIGRD